MFRLTPTRPRRLSLPTALLAAAAVAVLAAHAHAQTVQNYVAGDLEILNTNGAWSWFQDPRAIIDTDANKLLVSSTSDFSGTDGAARNGQVDVVEVDLTTGGLSRFVLGTTGNADDHNVASFYQRTDGRYVAAWSEHGGTNFTNFRVSTNPGDATAWQPTSTVQNGAGTTYENLHYLPNDDAGQGRLYNFTRTGNWDPNIQFSSDQGDTWTTGGKLLTQGSTGDRPYVRYASDGNKVHFITTETHPRNDNTSIYHGYVQDGQLFNSSGAQLDANLFDNTAVSVTDLTQVFAAGTLNQGDPMTRAWTVDLEVDSAGNPYGIFQTRIDPGTLSGGGDRLDHRFFYARHDGTSWNVNALADGGGNIYHQTANVSEADYTGLVALDPDNPDVVYMSSDIDPRNNADTAYYEVYKGTTADTGATWTWEAITENSTMDNVRPIVPDWDTNNTALLWMRGDYRSWTDWDTDIVAIGLGVEVDEPTDPPITDPTFGPITYVDANADNTSGDDFSTSTIAAGDNAGWVIRTGIANDGQVFAAAAGNASPTETTSQLTTVISGLQAGQEYDVFVYFWAPGGNENWDIQAGLAPGALDAFNTVTRSTDISTEDAATYFTNASPLVLMQEGNRELYQAYLGTATADASGNISVYVNDLTGNNNRTWYDGVGYAAIPEPASVALLGLGCLLIGSRRGR